MMLDKGREGVYRAIGVMDSPQSDSERVRRCLDPIPKVVRDWRTGLVLAAIVVVIASDFLGGSREFWREHEVVTGLVTGLLLAAFLLLAIERALDAKARRRWHPVGQMVSRQFEKAISIEDIFGPLVARHCETLHGSLELPEGKSYLEVLLLALQEDWPWEPEDERPGLLEEVQSHIGRIDSVVRAWAPVLMAEPALAEIGATATELQAAATRVHLGLAFGFKGDSVGELADHWAPNPTARRYLIMGLEGCRESEDQLFEQISAYRRGEA